MSHPAAATAARPLVLADLVAGTWLRDAVLVLCGAALTALGAQVVIHTGASPVPITGQTLGVVVAGAALGARRGMLSQLVYVLAGFLLPVYADGDSGPSVLWGATGGYLVGFVVAAWLIGALAERGVDRRPLLAVAGFALAQLSIFVIGVPWLKVVAGMDWGTAIHAGFTVFIVGGLVKAVLAGVVTPSAWSLAHRFRGR